ncbi:hypothetical protein, partial [Streptomyces sp. NPDC093261]|uniref:hypothetical protein n=1 Tax=Streptomyces sp. NPDC093261 TaxID=3366037 RepID=UPI003807DA53
MLRTDGQSPAFVFLTLLPLLLPCPVLSGLARLPTLSVATGLVLALSAPLPLAPELLLPLLLAELLRPTPARLLTELLRPTPTQLLTELLRPTPTQLLTELLRPTPTQLLTELLRP